MFAWSQRLQPNLGLVGARMAATGLVDSGETLVDRAEEHRLYEGLLDKVDRP